MSRPRDVSYRCIQPSRLIETFLSGATLAHDAYVAGIYNGRELRFRLIREAETLLDALREVETKDC